MSKVSVIVPVFNTEKYLEKCLESIINQTLKDIEIICINDCSTDHSLDILQKYAKQDKRVKIIDLPQNHGAGYARNRGIDAASGEYIGFVDSDDWIDSDFYEKLYICAKQTNADIIKSNLVMIKDNEIINKDFLLERIKKNKLKFIYVPSAIYKRNFIIENELFYPEDLKIMEDSVMEAMLSSKSNKIEIVDNTYYHYEYHDNSLNHPEEITLNTVKEIEKSFSRLYQILNREIKSYEEFQELRHRYDYLKNFIENKQVSDEVKEYVTKAQKRIYSSTKFAREIHESELRGRVFAKLTEERNKNIRNKECY